jgi:hypothetical protein
MPYDQGRRGSGLLGKVSGEDLFSGSPDWTLSIEVIQAPIQFGSLGFCERKRLGMFGELIPQPFQEIELFGVAELGDVDHREVLRGWEL